MSKKAPEDIYTDPALRERLKAEITAGDKGGKAGQWSARKAQLLAHEYEQAGGGYTTDKAHETAAQEHLDEWTEEEWTTADGKQARRGDETARYLPKEAWEELTPAQRRATDAEKREGSKENQQYVANTPAAKRARKDVDAHVHAEHAKGAHHDERERAHDGGRGKDE